MGAIHLPVILEAGEMGEVRLKMAPDGQSSKAENGHMRGNNGDEICVLPLPSQKRAFGYWVADVGTRFRKSHQLPIGGILDKMIDMLKNSGKPRDRGACDLIYKKLSTRRKESNRALSKNEAYDVITKKWLF